MVLGRTDSNKDNEKKDVKRKRCNVSASVVIGKQGYEGTVTGRALKRAGKNPNLKGHILEIMTCDRINVNPKNILRGKKAVLTKSTTAMRDDIVIKQGGKVVGRMQVKDTPKGIRDTVNKVRSGQYRGTSLVGTKETQNAYQSTVAKANAKGANITQKMSSNGISSQQTELLAKKALGGSVQQSAKEIGRQAAKAGMASGVISGSFEAAASTKQVLSKEKTLKQAVVDVSKEVAIGTASGAVGDAVATVATIVVAATPIAPAAPVIGTGAGVVASVITDNKIRDIKHEI